MKKARQQDRDTMRREYKPSDFRKPFVRGKYAKRLREASNVVVLEPEVAEAFPNAEAVNNALLSLLNLARATARPERRNIQRAVGHG